MLRPGQLRLSPLAGAGLCGEAKGRGAQGNGRGHYRAGCACAWLPRHRPGSPAAVAGTQGWLGLLLSAMPGMPLSPLPGMPPGATACCMRALLRLGLPAADAGCAGLDAQEAKAKPYIASMGIYVFRKELMCKLLREKGDSNDFGGEIIPAAAKDHKVLPAALHPGATPQLAGPWQPPTAVRLPG